MIKNGLLLLIGLFAGSLAAYAQSTVRGKVVDNTKTAAPGVSVQVKGSTTGVVTGGDGTYSIDVPANGTTLVFSLIGFATQEVVINGRSVLNVEMQQSSKSLDEVMVVAYGTAKKAPIPAPPPSSNKMILKMCRLPPSRMPWWAAPQVCR
ncbi:carboxypeptidase-like regulatory domain-containing protein [Chitinophaga sedimenti]|uniref:carboxypeptidase-like regulatory domain-containing protein n=1 Tax=Chitinophaga sedimenti TaxID=2033606 RepID=UPI002003E3F8|nr:carboxypeptidase-like regulatory domain-containing protein [Chitinophaga sedimenti]MCK7554937.1 carboxypeptidase-like regulatory domain-containing protein [Chitinophaga sedimenti]